MDLYLHRISRASHAFYHINRQAYTLSLLIPAEALHVRAEWNLTYSAENRLHWRAPGARGAYRGIVSGERYTEQYWQKVKVVRYSVGTPPERERHNEVERVRKEYTV